MSYLELSLQGKNRRNLSRERLLRPWEDVRLSGGWEHGGDANAD